MTVSVLNRTWEVEISRANRNDVSNAIYLLVRHKPESGSSSLLPGAIRFGLTELEANRIAHALIEATVDGDAREILRSLRDSEQTRVATKLTGKPEPETAPKRRFTKTQGSYLRFIHRYMEKFGRAPAESEIQRHFLVSAPSVNAMMQTLTRKGLISRVPGVARSIQLRVPSEELPVD